LHFPHPQRVTAIGERALKHCLLFDACYRWPAVPPGEFFSPRISENRPKKNSAIFRRRSRVSLASSRLSPWRVNCRTLSLNSLSSSRAVGKRGRSLSPVKFRQCTSATSRRQALAAHWCRGTAPIRPRPQTQNCSIDHCRAKFRGRDFGWSLFRRLANGITWPVNPIADVHSIAIAGRSLGRVPALFFLSDWTMRVKRILAERTPFCLLIIYSRFVRLFVACLPAHLWQNKNLSSPGRVTRLTRLLNSPFSLRRRAVFLCVLDFNI